MVFQPARRRTLLMDRSRFNSHQSLDDRFEQLVERYVAECRTFVAHNCTICLHADRDYIPHPANWQEKMLVDNFARQLRNRLLIEVCREHGLSERAAADLFLTTIRRWGGRQDKYRLLRKHS